MRKRRFLIGFVLFSILLLSSFLSVYSLSKDNIKNREKGYDEVGFSENEIEANNWQVDGNIYTSLNNDPYFIINLPQMYVNNVLINGSIRDIEDKEFKVYFISSEDEAFSEEKSFIVSPNLLGGGIYLSVGLDACALRLDLFEEPTKTAEINSIIINPHGLIFSFTSFFSVLSCFVTIIFFVIVIFLRKRFAAYTEVFARYKYLLSDLVTRDLKVKYRRSALGFLWSILNPLLMMLVITAVFSNIFKFDIKDFPIYYLTGILIFNFVSEATSLSINSIINGSGLIKKVYIPKYIFPLEKCLFAFVNMLFSLVAVAIVYAIIGVELHWTILLFPVPMIYAFVFSVGLSLILAALNVFFRDIGHLYSVWVTAWMYLTPIIYPVSVLPESMMTVIRLNPLYYYVTYIRNVMIYGIIPDLQDNLICIGFSLVFLGFGLFMFKKTQDRFILYI